MHVFLLFVKVETRRLGVIKSHRLVDKPEEIIPMTMFWLLLQFWLLAIVDGKLEQSMGYVFASMNDEYLNHDISNLITKALVGLGIMGSVLFTYVVGKVSELGENPSWFQDTLNKSHLNNYYWTLAVATAVIFVPSIILLLRSGT